MHTLDTETEVKIDNKGKKILSPELLEMEGTVSSLTECVISLQLSEQLHDEASSDVEVSPPTDSAQNGMDDAPQVGPKANNANQTNVVVDFPSTGSETEEEKSDQSEPSLQAADEDSNKCPDLSNNECPCCSLVDNNCDATTVYSFFPKTASDTFLYGAFEPVIRLQQERPIISTFIKRPVTVRWDEENGTEETSCIMSTKQCNKGLRSSAKTVSYFSKEYALPPDHFKPLFYPYAKNAASSCSTGSSTSSVSLNSFKADTKQKCGSVEDCGEIGEVNILAKLGLLEKKPITNINQLYQNQNTSQARTQSSLEEKILAQAMDRKELPQRATPQIHFPYRDIIKNYINAQSFEKQSKSKKIRHNKWKKKSQFADKGFLRNITESSPVPNRSSLVRNSTVAPYGNVLQTKQSLKHGFITKKPLKNSWSTGNCSNDRSPLPSLYQLDFNALKLCSNQTSDSTQKWFSLPPKLVSSPTCDLFKSKQENLKNNMLATKSYQNHCPSNNVHYLRLGTVQPPVGLDTPSTIARIPPLAKVFSVEELEKQMISGCAA